MLYEEIDDPESVTPADLRKRYAEALAAAVEAVGIDEAVAVTDLDREVVAAIAGDETPSVDLADAAAILALQDDAPGRDALLLEVRDHLLMGMSVAVMDVEALAAELDGDLSPKQLQQKIEGRTPMTLAEYAAVHHAIARGRS
jgi:hypothetical protein